MNSGQVIVVSAGTPVRGPAAVGGLISLVAHPDNGGVCWVGNDNDADGGTTPTTGYPLVAGGAPLICRVGLLSDLWFDAGTAGDVICWATLL